MNIVKKASVSVVLVLLTVNYVASTSSILGSKRPRFNFVPSDSPIDILTSTAKPTITPLPLTIVGSLLATSNATNTGSSLRVNLLCQMPIRRVLFGGIVHGKNYYFSHREYFWNLNSSRSAYISLDGRGARLQVPNHFFDLTYSGYEEASYVPDGVVQVVSSINVGNTPNILFTPTELKLRTLKEPGTTLILSEFFNFIYLFLPSIPEKYYYYRISYKDSHTGKIRYNTVLFLDYTITPEISVEQFEAVFGSVRNFQGKHYSNVKQKMPAGNIDIGVAEGISVGVLPL